MDDRRPYLLPALMLSFSVFFGIAGFGVGWNLGARQDRSGDLGKVRAALDRINLRYYPGVTPEAVIDGAIEGMTSKLDPYCEYFTAQEFKEFEELNLRGQFGGVGIVVGLDRASGYLQVETPIEDTPAFAADILPGDQIREVDGKSIKGQSLQEVVRKIKGPPDTQVTLTLARKGKEPFQVTLTRKIIVVKAVKSKMLPDGIGYIRISDFTEMTPFFDQEVKKLQDQGMKGLVIDLRFNGGGLLSECVKLSDRFLDDGTIVSTRGRITDDNKTFSAKAGDTLAQFPLVVLVNMATASASEIFAGAMKDTGRGVLVGMRTFGKGSVQTPFPLPDGAHLKITTARYYTPKGISVHREEGRKDFGLEPDYRVDMSDEENVKLMKRWNDERIVKGEKPAEVEKFTDFQLEAGLEVLRAKLAQREPKVEARVLDPEKALKPKDN